MSFKDKQMQGLQSDSKKPDGRELDVFFENGEKNQIKILEGLQNLTDDKLEIKDGKIIISEKGEGKKIDGTKLIWELVNSMELIKVE